MSTFISLFDRCLLGLLWVGQHPSFCLVDIDEAELLGIQSIFILLVHLLGPALPGGGLVCPRLFLLDELQLANSLLVLLRKLRCRRQFRWALLF